MHKGLAIGSQVLPNDVNIERKTAEKGGEVPCTSSSPSSSTSTPVLVLVLVPVLVLAVLVMVTAATRHIALAPRGSGHSRSPSRPGVLCLRGGGIQTFLNTGLNLNLNPVLVVRKIQTFTDVVAREQSHQLRATWPSSAGAAAAPRHTTPRHTTSATLQRPTPAASASAPNGTDAPRPERRRACDGV